jgi:hypothetical protein
LPTARWPTSRAPRRTNRSSVDEALHQLGATDPSFEPVEPI